MRRLAPFVVLLVLAGAASGSGERPVLALDEGSLGRASRLVVLDPRTLELRARGPALPGWAFGFVYARAPDGDRIAIVPRPTDAADGLFVVESRGARIVARIDLGGPACAVDWPTPSRLFVISATPRCYAIESPLEAIVVDPGARRVVARRAISGPAPIVAAEATSDGLALLLGPPVATLALVGVDDARAIPLPRVRWPAALAVDRAGARAFVAEPDFAVTEIDLVGGGVSRHPSGAVRQPALAAKGFGPGPVVEAAWAGSGMLAVAGGVVEGDGSFQASGARLVDTHTWRTRLLDPTAASVAVGAGLVVTYQGPYDERAEQAHGEGALVFTADGRRRYRALAGERIAAVRLAGRYAYVRRPIGIGEAFDLRTGRRTAYAISAGLIVSLLLGARGP